MRKKQMKGFACLTPERRSAIARMGGKAQGKLVNPGNFANNRERAKKAGSKGGRISRKPSRNG